MSRPILSNRQQENKYCLTEVRMGAFFQALAHSCRFMTVLLICSLFQIPTRTTLPGLLLFSKIIRLGTLWSRGLSPIRKSIKYSKSLFEKRERRVFLRAAE